MGPLAEIVAEDLAMIDSLVVKKMFGCEACYAFGRLMVVVAESGEEPWQGVLLATDRENHPSLVATVPELTSHPVLKKWLYLKESQEDFEEKLRTILNLVKRDDLRIGVLPKAKARKKRSRPPVKKARKSPAQRASRKKR